MAVPTPPADQSGGYMILGLTNGTDTHRMKVHVLPFSLTNFVVGGVAGASDDGNHDYAYTGSRPAGSEMGITDTFAALAAMVKGYYHSNWTITLVSLYQMQSGIPVEIFPTPTPTPVAGSSSAADAAGQYRALQVNYNFRTSGGHRARIVLTGSDQSSLQTPFQQVPLTGTGSNRDSNFVAYLTGANTAVVGHDGQKLQPPAHVTFVVNRRLRRHYGFA